jgi:hypothetical protein
MTIVTALTERLGDYALMRTPSSAKDTRGGLYTQSAGLPADRRAPRSMQGDSTQWSVHFGGQHGHVTKQELDLLHFAAIHIAEPGTRRRR